MLFNNQQDADVDTSGMLGQEDASAMTIGNRFKTVWNASDAGRFRTGIYVGGALYLACIAPAAYLSWRCNTNHGFGTPSKVIFSIIAGLTSFNYLIAYGVFKWGTCGAPKKK